ncbi:hypothetical protein ACFWFF_37330 [Streptomyces sp. NPDC060223]|uniref:hypothetical protein n=1 Tax=unclassified Streptomyces TaxID=2593676 RepID=UPI00363CC1D1
MSRRRTLSTKKKLALLVSAAAVAGSGAFALAATSNAASVQNASSSTVCQGLATAFGNNEKFIADQRAAPDAQSEARIANREAVLAQIKVQQEASGCAVGESAQDSQAAAPAAPAAPPASAPAASAPAEDTGGEADAGAATGEQVCNGSTVTLFSEAGAPAASSGEFPVGTELRVTNLDNNKSTTVEVTSVSGSCVLLNTAAFELVREPGKFVIRNVVVERVG